MNILRTALVVTATAVVGVGAAVAEDEAAVGAAAPDFTLTNAHGDDVSLSDYEGKYVVLEWVNFDCPFVKKHYGSGNMQAMQTSYIEDDMVWLSICSSAPGKQGFFDGEALLSRLEKEKHAGSHYLVDVDGTVGRTYGAQATPHMYVIDPEGTLVYAGAIDDKRSAQMESLEGAHNYVRAALAASMSGEAVDPASTKSYGCSVKY